MGFALRGHTSLLLSTHDARLRLLGALELAARHSILGFLRSASSASVSVPSIRVRTKKKKKKGKQADKERTKETQLIPAHARAKVKSTRPDNHNIIFSSCVPGNPVTHGRGRGHSMGFRSSLFFFFFFARMGSHTTAACCLAVFSRAFSRWFPRAIAVGCLNEEEK